MPQTDYYSEMVDLAPLLHHKITATPAARLPFASIRIELQCARRCVRMGAAIAQKRGSASTMFSTLHIALVRSLAARQLWRAALQSAGAQRAAAVHQVAAAEARIAMRCGCLKGAIQASVIEARMHGCAVRIRLDNGCAARIAALLCQQLGRRLALARQQRRGADIIIAGAEAALQAIQGFARGALLRQSPLIILDAGRAAARSG